MIKYELFLSQYSELKKRERSHHLNVEKNSVSKSVLIPGIIFQEWMLSYLLFDYFTQCPVPSLRSVICKACIYSFRISWRVTFGSLLSCRNHKMMRYGRFKSNCYFNVFIWRMWATTFCRLRSTIDQWIIYLNSVKIDTWYSGPEKWSRKASSFSSLIPNRLSIERTISSSFL